MNTVSGPLIPLTSSPYLLEDFPVDLLVTHFVFEVECSHNLDGVLQLPFVLLEADASPGCESSTDCDLCQSHNQGDSM